MFSLIHTDIPPFLILIGEPKHSPMKTTNSGLQHLKGMEAYKIYWEQYYQCRPRISTIMSIDVNLEIIVDSDFKLLAFRYDHPEDMKWMVINDGHWQVWKESDFALDLWDELMTIMSRVRHGVFQN